MQWYGGQKGGCGYALLGSECCNCGYISQRVTKVRRGNDA